MLAGGEFPSGLCKDRAERSVLVSLARASRPQQHGWQRHHPKTQTWIAADPFRG